MACSSGGAGLFLALKAMGVQPGDPVLLNAWTLAPVPGAIVHAGARPVFVKCGWSWTIDVDDLAAKAKASGAKVLLLVDQLEELITLVTNEDTRQRYSYGKRGW